MDISLKVVKLRLQQIVGRIEWIAENLPNGVTKISGLNNIRPIINELESLGLFINTLNSLKTSAIFSTTSDTIQIVIQEGNAIVSTLSVLKTLVDNFLDTLVRTLPPEDPSSINIKLPKINDFDELSKVARDIHLGLTQIILNDEIKGETKIISVENGSIWFNILVGASAVPVIASVAWSAAVVFKKIQEGRLMVEHVKGLKMKNEMLDSLVTAQKEQIDNLIAAEAEHVSSEHFKAQLPDNIERLKHSISTFAELISKGSEIHPALIAPENVSNLFPDLKNLVGLESKIKKIANG